MELVYTSEFDLPTIKTNWEEFNKITKSTSLQDKLKLECLFEPPTVDLYIKVYYAELGGTYVKPTEIDDESVKLDATFSSYKISKLMDSVQAARNGKNLEYNWDGTSLGVRQEGMTEYNYSDLKGQPGRTGLDGASVFGARVDERGHLILMLQDTSDEASTHKVVSLENDEIITKEQIISMMNDIARLNKEVAELKALLNS